LKSTETEPRLVVGPSPILFQQFRLVEEH